MNWLKNKIQNEKGSITLYVLVTMMLFLSVVLVTYIQSRNKNSTQLQQLGEIQKEYQSNDIDDIYEETETEYKGEINVIFYTPDGKVYNINEWTNQDLTMKITYPYDVKESDRYYYLDGERIKYTDNETIVENCVISTEYKGKTQDIHITKIDKKPATVTFDKNGDQYLLGENQTQTAVTTKITADDGEGSGVQKVEYQITTSTTEPAVDSDQWKEINKEQTIAEQKPGGIYYVYAKVTDNVGNVEIYRSNKFEVNYQVIYDVNGGTGAPASQVKVHGTNLTLTIQKPSKAGYEFIGWGTSANDTTVDYNPGGTYIANATIRLYAIYRKTIVATFNYYDEGPKSTTISEDIFNNETSVEITAPTIANVSRDGITLTGRGWSTDKSQTANIELKANEKVTISANSAYYASYSGTITGTFNYYDGSKAAKATSSATRYMNYEGTYTQNNISIPEEVTGSKGPASTTYSHVSTTKTGEGITPSTELGAINYYAVYKKTVTATLYTHNNQKTTKQGTAYGYYDGTTANATIGLGTASLSGYTARGWSTENTGNANINVALNGNASILNDTTYYMSYSYTVTATYYYYNGSSYTSSKQTATAYMNYVGTKIGAKPTTPTVSNPSGWTGRGWSTSSSATGATTTPGTITADATYYYSWSKSVTLTYNANGGSGAPAQETKTAYLNYAGSPTNASFTVSSTTPTRTGYTFQNWNTASNGSGTTYNAGANISTTNNTTLNAIWKINTYKIDLNFYVDGTPYWSGYQGTRIKAGLKINGVDKGYVTDYGGSHEYGSTWEVYGVELDGVKVAYSKTGTLTSTFSLNLEFNTMKFVANNSSYGTVSSSELIIAKGNKYSTSGTTLTLADGRKVTAAVTNVTGYTTTFSSWSPTSGTVNAATTVTANFSRTINSYYIDLNIRVNGTAYGKGYNNRITVGLKVGGVNKGYVQDYYQQHTYGTTWEIYGAKLDGVQVAYTASGTVGAANTSINPDFNTIAFKSNNTSYGTVSSSELLIVKGRTFSTSGTTLTLQDGRKVTATVKNATGYTTKLSSWSPASGTVNAATTVTANFSRTINSYTVTYNFSENGGQSATKTSATVNYGAAIDLTPTASKSGYTFIGWNTNKDATSKLSSLNMGTSNVTLYAIYSKTITATFNYSGGSKSVSGTMYNKATTVSIQAPDVTDTASANGVTFNIRGWSTSSAANAVIELNNNASKALSNNTTYYASYSATITATLYTYNNQKTAKTGTAYLNYAGSVTNASIPLGTTSLSGYSFRGWSTSTAANAGITVAANGTASINKNTTYYASYSYTVTATLYTYNNQKTTKTGTAYMGYTGSKINASIGLGTTSLSGYSFRGWSTSNAANASITVGANGTASINTNTTYYASYSYTVTATYYYYNGKSFTSSKPTATAYMNYTGGKIGAKPTTPSVSNPSGWTGRGWSTSSSATGTTTTPGTITGNATYYYSWSKSVTLSYNANGGSGIPGSQSGTAYLNYAGSTTNASFTVSSTTPTRAGWTFQGWSTSSSATSASYKGGSTIGISTNTTLYAVWKDTIAPTMGTLTKSSSGSGTSITLTGKATDVGSGISYYQFSTNGSLTASSGGWISRTNSKTEITQTTTVSSGGTYYFYAKDAAGNVNKKAITITKKVSLYSGPNKTLYLSGEKVNYTGIRLKLDFGDGVVNIIDGTPYVTNCTENTNPSQTQKYTITVKYETSTFTITTYKYQWYGTKGKDWYYWYGANSKAIGDVTLTYNGKTNNFYFDSNGIMYRGWRFTSNNWRYYLNAGDFSDAENKEYAKNWQDLYNAGFTGGALVKSQWANIRDNSSGTYYWYYLDASGNMLKGWQWIGSEWYYLKEDGFTGWNGPVGSMTTGWKFIDGSWYFLDDGNVNWSGPLGSMLRNTTVTIDGKSYNFNSSGVCTNP